MSPFSKRVLLATAFAFLVAAVSALPGKSTQAAPSGQSVTVNNTTANPVPTSQATHLGQPASSFVLLRCNNFTQAECTGFRRQHPDGTEDQTTFAILPGMLLVITDVNWTASSTAAGTDVRFFILNSTPSILHGQATVTNAGNFAAGGALQQRARGLDYAHLADRQRHWLRHRRELHGTGLPRLAVAP